MKVVEKLVKSKNAEGKTVKVKEKFIEREE
jgi:hypothetical protein